jgi:hypothetical protein
MLCTLAGRCFRAADPLLRRLGLAAAGVCHGAQRFYVGQAAVDARSAMSFCRGNGMQLADFPSTDAAQTLAAASILSCHARSVWINGSAPLPRGEGRHPTLALPITIAARLVRPYGAHSCEYASPEFRV